MNDITNLINFSLKNNFCLIPDSIKNRFDAKKVVRDINFFNEINDLQLAKKNIEDVYLLSVDELKVTIDSKDIITVNDFYVPIKIKLKTACNKSLLNNHIKKKITKINRIKLNKQSLKGYAKQCSILSIVDCLNIKTVKGYQ